MSVGQLSDLPSQTVLSAQDEDNFGEYLKVRGVSMVRGSRSVLSGVDLTARRGELIGLLGPSGTGKSTLLNIVAGFLRPDSGSVRIDGDDVSALPPYRREFGVMFQGYALFPHMTVHDNVAFGLRRKRLPRHEVAMRVEAILERFELSRHSAKRPAQLSGGEQQRVALARCLVLNPRLLLLDEPLSSLDAALRHRIKFEIRNLLREQRMTSVFVTHDQEEAFALCDKIAILHDGVVQQYGSGADLFERPANAFIAEFVGNPNRLGGRVQQQEADRQFVRIDISGFSVVARAAGPLRDGSDVTVFVRPEAIAMTRKATTTPTGEEAGVFVIRDMVTMGMDTEVWLDGPCQLRCTLRGAASPLAVGMAVDVSVDPRHAHAFPRQ
jgi:ABC-type Fe3+/spermidine/putrescine transport system ATPase subunit